MYIFCYEIYIMYKNNQKIKTMFTNTTSLPQDNKSTTVSLGESK